MAMPTEEDKLPEPTVTLSAIPIPGGFAIRVALQSALDAKDILLALGSIHVALEQQIAMWINIRDNGAPRPEHILN